MYISQERKIKEEKRIECLLQLTFKYSNDMIRALKSYGNL